MRQQIWHNAAVALRISLHRTAPHRIAVVIRGRRQRPAWSLSLLQLSQRTSNGIVDLEGPVFLQDSLLLFVIVAAVNVDENLVVAGRARRGPVSVADLALPLPVPGARGQLVELCGQDVEVLGLPLLRRLEDPRIALLISVRGCRWFPPVFPSERVCLSWWGRQRPLWWRTGRGPFKAMWQGRTRGGTGLRWNLKMARKYKVTQGSTYSIGEILPLLCDCSSSDRFCPAADGARVVRWPPFRPPAVGQRPRLHFCDLGSPGSSF